MKYTYINNFLKNNIMIRKLILQVNVPYFSKNKKLRAYTYIEDMYNLSEKQARKYAAKCNADYYKVVDPDDWKPAAGKHVTYQKMKVYDLTDYDLIVYLDSDYIIKDNAPNLFELCGNNFSAVTDPGSIVNKLANKLGVPRERYFNAGFFYITKPILDLSRSTALEYIKKDWDYEDQGLWNRMFYDLGIEYHPLKAEEWNPTEETFGLYADHYAGSFKSRWDSNRY